MSRIWTLLIRGTPSGGIKGGHSSELVYIYRLSCNMLGFTIKITFNKEPDKQCSYSTTPFPDNALKEALILCGPGAASIVWGCTV